MTEQKSKQPKKPETKLVYVQLMNGQGLMGEVPENCPLLKGRLSSTGKTALVNPLFVTAGCSETTIAITHGHPAAPLLHSPIKKITVRHSDILFSTEVESQLAFLSYKRALDEKSPFAAIKSISEAILAEEEKSAKEKTSSIPGLSEDDAKKEELLKMETPSKLPS
jgi:hypothetical protein